MNRSSDTFNLIKEQAFLPLFFHSDVEVSINILSALYDAGIRIIEYTNRGEEAFNNFKELIAYKNAKNLNMQIGAGTIKNTGDAKKFIEIGADFIVCPGIIPEIGAVVQNAGLLWIPGCMTTTEIIIAEGCEASLIKLFPGNLLQPSYVVAIKELFPNLYFMPTGGVELNKENIEAWFNAGVCAVGIGSKLFSKEIIEKKNYTQISLLAKKGLEIIQSLKKNNVV
ncbi:MAG: bifunctional 4-hydroxy-2-oxoglutarate aldolase/2-dehydro-3-deoxy-phosphogluconate aldolase [Chitinophagaceae bacterium]